MLKTANVIKGLKKAGATVEGYSPLSYIARFPAANVYIYHEDGYVSNMYVLKHGQRDNIVTDSFPGTFVKTIRGAIELAQRMATW